MPSLCHGGVLVFLWMALLSACQTPPPSNRLDAMADQYCACTTRLSELNQQLGDPPTDSVAAQRFEARLQAIQEEYDKVRDCTLPLITKLGTLQKEELPALQQRLLQRCPVLAQHGDLLWEMLGE